MHFLFLSSLFIPPRQPTWLALERGSHDPQTWHIQLLPCFVFGTGVKSSLETDLQWSEKTQQPLQCSGASDVTLTLLA